jgi:hypothetical protein
MVPLFSHRVARQLSFTTEAEPVRIAGRAKQLHPCSFHVHFGFGYTGIAIEWGSWSYRF